MAKKILIGAAILGLSVLLIAMLVPTVMAELEPENVCNPDGEHKGFGPRDDDDDGIPNGQDPDYERPENSTGDGPHGKARQSKNSEQGNGDSEGPEDGSGNMYQAKDKNSDKDSGNKGSGDKTKARDQSCME